MEDRNSRRDASRHLQETLSRVSAAIFIFALAFILALLLGVSFAREFADQYLIAVIGLSAALALGIAYAVSGVIARAIRGRLRWQLVAILSGPLVIFAVMSLTFFSYASFKGTGIQPTGSVDQSSTASAAPPSTPANAAPEFPIASPPKGSVPKVSMPPSKTPSVPPAITPPAPIPPAAPMPHPTPMPLPAPSAPAKPAAGTPPSKGTTDAIPLFPWPPPAPSAMTRLRVETLHPSSLGFVADYLENELTVRGYDQQAWFGVPDGFALVTRLEQTDERGRPLTGLARWSADAIRLREFSITAILESLFSQPKGYFRVLVFIVTPAPMTQDKPVVREEAIRWLTAGADRIPSDIRSLPYDSAHHCSALIYEFDIQNRKPSFNHPGRLSAMNHLAATRLLLF